LAATTDNSEACPRPLPGSAIASPPELRTSGEKLDISFSFQTMIDSGGLQRYCYIHDDNGEKSLAPTIRAKPGDTVVLRLTNELTAGGNHAHTMGGGNACSGGEMTSASTNLHFHGLNLPPKCHQDDVIHTSIQPSGAPFEYRFQIPSNQPPGLYWYHPHPHGFSEAQVLGGASGALIVEGIERVEPWVAGLPERVLILRDQPVPRQHNGSGDSDDAVGKDLSLNFVPITFPLYLPPVMRVRPDEKEFWRVLNASADTYFDLQVVYVQGGRSNPQDLRLIAVDGSPSRHGMSVTKILIPPGGRAEFIVITPPTGAFAQLVSREYDTGIDGAKNPGRVIANIVSNGSAPEIRLMGSSGSSIADAARTSPIAAVTRPGKPRQRRLYFSENRQDLKDPAKPALYFITEEGKTPAVFDMHSTRPDITVRQGSVEDWVIENRATEAHVFHIHQLHFLVLQRDGRKVEQPDTRDTIDLPPWDGRSVQYPSVRLRMDFRDPAIVGTFVYHCHILEHEDAGMMGSIQVVARRK
jgi:FtsP/CotA-like multicopper oxidase with cupredoxin domain